MRQTEAVHIALKKLLREAGLTYGDVALHLGISESNVKRLFAKSLLSLERIERLCDWLNIDFMELARCSRQAEKRITHLTLAQEKKLLTNPKLFLLTYLLLNDWTRQEINDVYQFTPSEMTRLLVQLDRMGLIELLPFDRVRLLTARNFSWNKNGPIAQFLQDVVLKEFMGDQFTQSGEKIEFLNGMLSTRSAQQVHELIEDLARRFDALIAQDLTLPIAERNAVSMLCCFRPWEFSTFSQYRKEQER